MADPLVTSVFHAHIMKLESSCVEAVKSSWAILTVWLYHGS